MRKQSEPFVCLDGTLIRTDRVAVRDPDTGHLWYSGKHTEFGANIQVLADHTGYPVWISPLEPGLTHDITAARRHVLPALYPGRSPGAAHPGRQELHRSRHQYQDPHQGRQTLPRQCGLQHYPGRPAHPRRKNQRPTQRLQSPQRKSAWPLRDNHHSLHRLNHPQSQQPTPMKKTQSSSRVVAKRDSVAAPVSQGSS